MKAKLDFVLALKNAKFTSGIGKATKGVGAFKKEVGSSLKTVKQLDRGLTGMAGRLSVLFAGVSTVAFSKSIWDAGVAMQSMNNGFKAITGSAEAAGKELDFVRQTSDDLGLNFQSTVDAYKSLAAAARGTALEGKDTREIFLGISEASTVLGLSADQTSGALQAISQMISKGAVQAEELRGQLGERLPGAFQLAAKAMGVTTQELDKMLKDGKVAATDLLPKLADALHDLYGKAAIDQSDGAIQALNRFQNAWFDLKAGIAESGFLDVATGRIKDLTTAMNDPAVKERIVELSGNFFKMADAVLQFTINHGEAMAKVAAGAVALSALSRAVRLLTGIWQGLNAATLVITGSRLLPYLATLRNSLGMTQIAAMGLSGAMGAAAGATLALLAGYKAGEWLTMHKHWEAIAESAKQLEAYSGRVSEKFAQISRATGVVVSSMDELDQAVKDGKLHYDELTGEWVAGAAKMVAATQKATTEQKAATVKATAEMKAAWQKYAAEINRLQDQIAGRERSLAGELRAMARSGMSDASAWHDRKKEAQEYEAAARKAAAAGNFDEAVKLVDHAKTAYKDLNEEVKSGDTVLVSGQQALQTSMAGVKSSGELAIDILDKQKTAAEEAADALNKEVNFSMGEAFTEAGENAKALADLSGSFEDDWRTAFINMGKDAAQQIDAIDRNLDAMAKNRDVYIHVHEVQAKATGGPVQRFATGGRLPGYGGGDRIPALLEAGEYIIRKEAVNRFGAGIFHALNNLRLPEIPRFATGGPVGAGAGDNETSGATVKIDLGLIPGKPRVTLWGKRQAAMEVARQFEEIVRGASS